MYDSAHDESTFKTCKSRDQGSLLPPPVQDCLGPANPVRAIESFVCALNLAKLGFRHAPRVVGAGQPPYDPADLLKLHLYGYTNQVTLNGLPRSGIMIRL
jgi:hypothetical protein